MGHKYTYLVLLFGAMKNITITLDPETAAWVRVHAAEQNKSVSRLVGEILSGTDEDRREYRRAMRALPVEAAFRFERRA